MQCKALGAHAGSGAQVAGNAGGVENIVTFVTFSVVHEDYNEPT